MHPQGLSEHRALGKGAPGQRPLCPIATHNTYTHGQVAERDSTSEFQQGIYSNLPRHTVSQGQALPIQSGVHTVEKELCNKFYLQVNGAEEENF